MSKKIRGLKDLSFDNKNINQGSEFGSALLTKSLTEVGAGRSVLADKNGVLIAGNKTVEAFGAVGNTKIRVVETTGDELVVVQRTDLDINSVEGAKMKVLDNTVSKHNYIEDAAVAEAICEEYDLNKAELGLTADVEQEAQEDNFDAAPPLNPITVMGDVYELNQHRFSCGSSTEADVVKKTLAGAKPILMVTDPPYGVNYRPKWRNEALGEGNCQTGEVKNDDRVDWTDAYSLFTGNVAYVWHGGHHAKQVAQNLEDCGFTITAQIIWAKQHFAISRGDYHFQHEPCWYAVKKGSKHNWQGSRKESSLWEINNGLSQKGGDKEIKTGHGTQKPIECMARPIRNNTFERESVYDPFLGSGTTLIAADQLNRSCYGQEIDPAYCDIIVARFIKYKRSQSNGTEAFTVKRNGSVLSEEELEKYLAQIESK